MDVVVTGLRELIAGLGKGAVKALPESRKVVERGSMNIKKDWRQRWTGHPHIKRLPFAVTYDIFGEIGGWRGQIGPDKTKPQGPLGNVIEFGTENNAPIPGGLPALEAEAPKFEKALQDLGVQLLES